MSKISVLKNLAFLIVIIALGALPVLAQKPEKKTNDDPTQNARKVGK